MPIVWPQPRTEAAKAGRIAVLDFGGWFDIFSPCLFSDRAELGGNNNRTVVAAKGHGGVLGGELKYPPQDGAGASAVAWFGHWLKGEDNGVMNSPPVAYFLMGDTMDAQAPGNRWKQAEHWPIASTPASFYLTKERELKAAAGEGGELAYAYDPKNPAPTIGGPNMGQNNGPQDQRKLKIAPTFFGSRACHWPPRSRSLEKAPSTCMSRPMSLTRRSWSS
jgi:putative CocE/NonD family hydrolase